MRTNKIIYSFILAATLALPSCSLEDIDDPNHPSLASATTNATSSQIQTLITGLEKTSGDYVSTTSNAEGTFGREIWYFNFNDPRFVQQWTGMTIKEPDENFYGVGSIWTSPYHAIKQANVLIDAVASSSAVSDEDKKLIDGFALTIQGYQYLVPANALYNNGIRLDVKDELNPGPFVSYQEALTAIQEKLQKGYEDLATSSETTLPFALSNGYADFNSPKGLAQVNRALAARTAIYQEKWQDALNYLKDSFFDLNGDLNLGPAHVYGAPPESYNPLYYERDADLRAIPVVHPSFVADAVPGDKRVAEKVYTRKNGDIVNSVGTTALASKYQDNRWKTNTDPIKYIRNEELILIYAEANIQLGNFDEAIKALNVVRNAAGIGDYTGEHTKEALIDDLLYERRYSLWFEPSGHRWVDLRRYNKLDELPTDGGAIFMQLARPESEVNWDEYSKSSK